MHRDKIRCQFLFLVIYAFQGCCVGSDIRGRAPPAMASGNRWSRIML